jgi:hypothetical protein
VEETREIGKHDFQEEVTVSSEIFRLREYPLIDKNPQPWRLGILRSLEGIFHTFL